MMTVDRDHVRPPRHHRRRVQPGVEHAALRLPHEAPARLRRELPARAARGTGMGKRDLTSNINWFMNVPVEADGTLGHRRRHLGAGPLRGSARRDGRARRSSPTARRSTTPATAFNPTPDPRSSVTPLTAVRQGPDREPGRDRVPHHPHAATAWASSRSRCTPTPTATRRTCAWPTRRCGIGPAPPADSYLSRRARPRRGRASIGADAVHPGYGFLAENAEFAAAVEARRARVHRARRPSRLRAFGAKDTARDARRRGRACRCSPGTGSARDARRRRRDAPSASAIPVMLKSVAAAAGSAWCAATGPAELADAVDAGDAAGRAVFGDPPGVPRAIRRATRVTSRCRSSATATATCRVLGERDCSMQRRHQKVIEETPAPELSPSRRAPRSCDAAVRLLEPLRYRSAGTVEFVVDADARGVLLPRGEHAPAGRARRDRGGHRRRSRRVDGPARRRRRAPFAGRGRGTSRGGHAIEVARLRRGSRARTSGRARGLLTEVALARRARGSTPGSTPAPRSRPYYDPLLAKIVVHGPTAPTRSTGCSAALAETRRRRHRDQPRRCCGRSRHRRRSTRATIDDRRRSSEHRAPRRDASRCSRPGAQTTVQDLPGRLGYWHVGRAAERADGRPGRSRSANRRARQRRGRAGPRVHRRTGPTLRFATDARRSASTGAAMDADRRRRADVPWWTPFAVAAGSMLRLGARRRRRACAPTCSCRAGSTCPPTSAAAPPSPSAASAVTAGRALRAGDVLHVGAATASRRGPDDRRVDASRPPLTDDVGARACSTVRTPRPTSSPPTDIDDALRQRRGRCTTTPSAPACG